MAQLQNTTDLKELIPINQLAMIEAEPFLEQANSVNDIFNMGMRFFRYQKYDLAFIFFYKIIEEDEKNAEAYVNIGNIFYKLEDEETAAKFWKTAIKIKPTTEKAYLNLGNYHFKKGNIEESISLWLILYSMNPFETRVLSSLGMAYDKKDDIFLSNMYYLKYLDKAGANPTPAYGKVASRMAKILTGAKHNFKVGVQEQNRKEYRKAMKAYMNVLHTMPNHLKANLNMGSICFLFEKFEDAIKYWHKAFILAPRNKNNIGNLAIAYDKLEQFSYAYAFFKRYLTLIEDIDSFDYINIKNRLDELEKLLGDKQAPYSSHYTKAEECLRKKDYFNALIEYENCYYINPENEELKKKISALKSNLYPEEHMGIRCLEKGKALYSQRKINAAIDFFKKAFYLDRQSATAIEAKDWLKKCAELYQNRKNRGLY